MENMEYTELMTIIGESAKLARTNTENVSVVLAELKSQRTLLNGMSNVLNDHSDAIAQIQERQTQYELREEVTTEQETTIRNAAAKRVYEIIGNDVLDTQKYFRTFISRLYSDLRKNAGLGSSVSKTQKGNFQRCIDYIEAWTPGCGCAPLKMYVDENAKARMKARESGYVV